jgi:uroporphyrinogen-III synthase
MAINKKKSIKKPSAKTNGKKVKKATVTKTVKKVTKKASPKKITKKVVAKKPALKKTAPLSSKKAVKKAKPTVNTKKQTKKVVVKKATALPADKAGKKTTPKQPRQNEVKVKKVVAVAKSKPEIKVKVPSSSKTEVVASAEKFVKIGVKTKKQLVPVTPQPVIEVSNHPKSKIKTILISQPKPENEKNPYYDLANKYNLIETFRQFIKIEGLPVKDFRNQRIDILEHKAVILTSRMAVDHYFRMCNEMRVTVPESMKYFCINEATAYYLQKYIQYRKRKIFFGHQTIQDLVDVIRKNKEEKFLLPAADVQKEQICEFLDAIDIKYTKAVMYRTVSADLSDIKNLNDYDCLVFFTPAGINSLKQNFPNFKQGNTRIACFGAATANALKSKGYRLDIYAPNPKNPSMSGALDEYMKESNKR